MCSSSHRGLFFINDSMYNHGAYELALGPRLRPKVATTLTKRLLYCSLRLARPVFFFFFSCFSTFGVCPFTLPARARDPCTLPANRYLMLCENIDTRTKKQTPRNAQNCDNNYFSRAPPPTKRHFLVVCCDTTIASRGQRFRWPLLLR